MNQFLNKKAIHYAARPGIFRAPAGRTGSMFAALLLFVLSFSGNAQIALRGTSSGISTSSSTVTVNKPSGVAENDIMFATVANYCSSCSQTSASLSGWTVVAGTDVERGRATLLYKVAGASEPGSYAFAVTSSSTAATGGIVAFSGVNTTTPFDVAAATSWTTQTAQNHNTIPSLTTSTANAALLMFASVARVTSSTASNYSGWTTATFGNLTEVLDAGHNAVNNSPAIGASWALDATPGATGAGSVNCAVNTSGRTQGGILVSLRPCQYAGAASATPTVCLNTAMTSITHATTAASGIGAATGLPAGVTASWASNTITISGTPTAAGTFNYSIPLTGSCSNRNATGTITVVDGGIGWANLQFPGSQTICIGNNFTAYGQIYKAGITEAAGANAAVSVQFGFNASNTNPNTWAAGNWSAATYNTQSGNNDEYSASFGSTLAVGTYYYAFRYSLNGCAWNYGGFSSGGGGFWNGTGNNSGVLTVSPNNTAGTASSTPTLCINTALTNITHSTTGATGIGTATGLPAGVSASWASNTITISGTPSVSGTFNYSIPLTGGCGSVNATGIITVSPVNTISRTSAVGTDAQLKCINTAITNITYATTGATGATFSGLPAGVNGAWAGNVVTISGTPTAYGLYNYTVTLTGGCGTVTATGSINVNGLDYANLQFPGTQTICIGNNFTAYGQVYEPGITEAAGANVNIVAQFGYNTSNTNPSTWPAGNWSAAAYNVQSGNNDEYSRSFGSALAAGTYYYTFRYAINGCSWQYGGAFSGFWDGTSNVNGVLTVSPNNTAGTASSNPTLCINTPLTSITRTTTGATGIGTPSNLPAGVSASWASNVLTISGTPTASGTFNYSIPLTGGCGSVNATGTITVTANNTITRTSASGTDNQSPCVNTAITNITYSTVRATGATFSGLPAGVTGAWAGNVVTISGTPTASGTFNYTVTLTGGCGTVTASGTITVNARPTLSSNTPGSRCGTGSVVLAATSATGTVNWYSLASGGTSLASGNTFNTPSISANTTYYADVISAAGCAASSRTAVLATINTIPTVATTTPGSRCGTGTLGIGATASSGTINWYDAAVGGTLLGSGNSFTTPSITASSSFFAEAVSAAGCVSASRTAVLATVNEIPSITSTTPGSSCGTGTVTLGAAASAGTISWFTVSSGGAAIATGASYSTPSISATTTYFVEASSNGCTSSPRTSVVATISSIPSVSSFINGNRCGSGSVTLLANPSGGATLNWFTASTGGSSIGSGNSYVTPSLSATTTYYVQASIGTCVQPSRTAVTANINAFPVISVASSYCTVPGFAVLTATAGMSSYSWSTGQTGQSINVDQAGVYSVIGTNAAGCKDTATFGVATELVTNGSFDAGNSGFTTNYTYKADLAGVNDELLVEGTYAIVPNPNTVHAAFYGADRHGDGGNIMVVNGSPALGQAVWSQNSITVQPNTTYYFSAWAMSVVNGNNAVLQFSINGNQVGTIAYLQNSYTNNAGPYTWTRFFGQWNSGSTTSANLSIVNLNQVLGGNDFALDDISFGTMSPIALSATPKVNSGASACAGNALVLNSDAIGGASPFTYSWTGPGGFTSSLENPQVSANASSIHNGTYSVTVTDGFGCAATSNVTVSVSPLPANQTLTAASASVCTGGSTSINLGSSQTDVFYQLRNNADDSPVGSLVQGTGAAISLPTGVLTASTTFNVVATRFPSNCDVQMSGTVTVSQSLTPVLSITNQATCSGTVDLTAAAVTAGSTGSGTLSYWNNDATTPLATPSAVAASGIYYIKSTNGSCSDIQPVIVSINSNPTVTFAYGAASFCTTGSDPIPSLSGAAGVFSAIPAGMVFANNNTGEIDLSATAPGTYTVTNTVTPSGACPAKSASQTVSITAAPLAGFNYSSNDFCQSANALNAEPVFAAGAQAGTFSSSAGLAIDAATGIINVSASTPGNYAVVNTRPATGGCPSFSDTTFLDINPYIFAGGVNSSASAETICEGQSVSLFSSAGSYATVLLRENFNGSINNWVRVNNSTGGTPANAEWKLRMSPYNYNGNDHSSNDNSQFYMSNAQAQASGTTNTILRSPVMSTVGFTTLSLDFFHHFNRAGTSDVAKVQISTNNTVWTDIATFNVDEGSRTGFINKVYNLNSYIGLPTVYIRFTFTASPNSSSARMWAIDNISVTGNSTNYSYAWTSSPSGYTSAQQNPTGASPVTNTYYIATATNGYGCSNPASPVPVTVNPRPADNAGDDQNICGAGSVNIGAVATAGNTYAWTPATGLSDASAANPVATPGTTRTYTLTETISATGCSRSSDVVLTVTPLPSITASSGAGRCGTGTVNLSATSSTGTLSWFTAAVGGSAIGSGASFTTPSLATTTVYYAEATSATCAAGSRTAVTATVNAAPVISAQSTPAATYSVNQPATALSVTASAGSGSISSYQWFSNASASNIAGTAIASSNADTYVPSTAVAGTLYYYCVVTNSNGCTATSAVSGAIATIVTPSFTGVSATSPYIPGQAAASGYNGQTITINGANFAADASVSFNGVSAASVTVVNSGKITAVVNNTGASSSGNLTVTNPSTGAFASTSFSFIGYISNQNNFVWSNTSAWLGGVLPVAGSDVTIRHSGGIGIGASGTFNRMIISSGSQLDFGTDGSISVTDLQNDGIINWTSTGTLNISGQLTMAASGSIEPGNGTIVYNKVGNQAILAGAADEIDFNNLVLQGSGVKSLPAGVVMEVANLNIGAGVTFSPGSSATDILVLGNLSVNGNMDGSISDFHFQGTTDQSISVAGTGTAVFSGLRVNKTAGTLLLNDNVRILDSLTMIAGNINTQGNILEIGSSTASKGVLVHSSGYIHGIVRRWYAGINSGAATGLFPMGELKAGNVWENRNALLEYTTAPALGGHLTVEFIPVSMNDNNTGTQTTIDSSVAGGTGFNISTFAEEGYWKIDNQTGTLTDGAYTIALTAENFTSIGADISMLSLVKRVSMGNWFAPGQHIAATGDLSVITISRSGVSGFSNFGFGIGEPNVPLPVTISSMSVNCDGLYPSLNWTTVSEKDASQFAVQQSADGRSWKNLGTVAAAGNSDKTLRYSFSLENMSNASAYVRLVLQNKDASEQAFAPLAVSCRQSLQKEAFTLYPNPTEGAFIIDLQNTSDATMSIRVLNTMGVEVAQQLHNAARSSQVKMDLNGFAAGIYQVLVGTEGEAPAQSFKLIIK